MGRSTVIIKTRDGADDIVASCEFGDDAELLFHHYKKMGLYVRVEYHGLLSDETTLEFNPKLDPNHRTAPTEQEG